MPFFINNNQGRVAILAILIVVLWRSIKRRARTFIRLLESDALRFLHSDDGLMLNCNDKELLEGIIQAALRRGHITLQKATSNVKPEMSTGTSFYHANSSSGDSSESIDNSLLNEQDEPVLWKPQQMIQQVGGVASHKQPVLTLEPHYILKPLRLTHLRMERHQHDYNGAKDGLKDKTKVYRGVREIAFYEALAFASRLSHVIVSCMEPYYNSSSMKEKSIGHLLSCHYNIFRSSSLSFSNEFTSNDGPLSIVSRVKDMCTSADSWDRIAFLLAHFAGDEAVMSAFKSYIDTCTTLATTIETLNKMSDFTPTYYGVVDLRRFDMNEDSPPTTTTMSHPHLLLGNITSNFRHPNIIDIKMGTQAYEPSAPESKQRREIKKYPKQAEFGLRIVGLRVYDKAVNDYICEGKSFGTGLMTKAQIIGAFRMFFCVDRDCSNAIRPSGVDDILRQLNRIIDWFENVNSDIAIYAGSILIVYEGDTINSAFSEPPAVKMIDFAHVCRKQGGDDGYLKGIKTLFAMLHEIRNTMPS